MNPNIIYGLVDPRTLMVRYVGQSSRGMKRPMLHAQEGILKRDTSTYKVHWIRQLKNLGLKYEVAVLQDSTPETLDADECWWIAYGRACGWPLTNLKSGGGRGASFSRLTRDRMSAARKGRKHSEETKQKIGNAHKGRQKAPGHLARLVAGRRSLVVGPEYRKRLSEAQRARRQMERELGIVRPLSDETRARMSASQRLRTQSEATRKKISIATKGRKRSPETIAKVLAAKEGKPPSERLLAHIRDLQTANLGRKQSEETIAKRAATQRGSKRTEETKAKMAASARARWARQRENSGGH